MDIVLLVSIGFAVFFSALAAYFDYKTTYIFDWITYPMILVGLILLPFKPTWYIGLISAAIVFVFFIPFYKYGKIGGGDIKYFLGLCLLMPYYGNMYFILPVFFFASALAGLFFGIKFIALFIAKKYYDQVEKMEFILKILLALAFSVFAGIFLSFGYAYYIAVSIAVLFFICMFVLLFQSYFYMQFSYKIKLENILEDDIVELSCLNKKGTKLVDKKLISELKSKKVKELIVYRNLPIFAPFLLLGVIISLFVFL